MLLSGYVTTMGWCSFSSNPNKILATSRLKTLRNTPVRGVQQLNISPSVGSLLLMCMKVHWISKRPANQLAS